MATRNQRSGRRSSNFEPRIVLAKPGRIVAAIDGGQPAKAESVGGGPVCNRTAACETIACPAHGTPKFALPLYKPGPAGVLLGNGGGWGLRRKAGSKLDNATSCNSFAWWRM